MRSIHMGVAQIQSKAMDVQGNLSRMHRQIQAAAVSGVEAILFAETCIHAYCLYPENLALAESLDGAISSQVSEWAQKYNMTIMAGMLEKSELGIHNSHIVASPAGSVFTVRKHNLTQNEINAKIVPGQMERTPFDINGVRCGLIICADHGVAAIYDDIKTKGIEMLFMGTAGGGYRKDYIAETDLAAPENLLKYIDNRTRVFIPHAVIPAHEFKLALATANALGDDGVFMTHQGHCLIIDRHRIVRAQIPGTNIADHFLDQMAHAVLYF